MDWAPIILFGSFFIFLVLGIPISFTLAFASLITIFYLDLPLMVVGQKLCDTLDNFSLMAIPFFILAGQIMSDSGIARRLVEFSGILVGRIRGGLAFVNIVASMFFGGMSGSSVADTASIGSILIPSMVKKGYDRDYSIAVTVTSSTQGLIIPPSHNAIIFAYAAGGLSIARIFLAGAIPGVMIGLFLMIPSYIIAVKRNYPVEKTMKFKESIKIVKEAFFGLMTIVIIIGGILTGIFTATEASAIAVVYAFLVAFFIYREINIKDFWEILWNACTTIIAVMFLIAAASTFGWLMAYLRIPNAIAQTVLSISHNKYVILFSINIILLLLGMIMDMAPLILITTPIFLPIVTRLGINPIHFGIIMLMNLGVGLCTPPVGNTLFVGCIVGKRKIENVVRVLAPFYLVMIIVLLLVTYFPFFSMWLPEVVLG
ncbi:MAG: TRAP dicarboxylate transporter, DctM subunit [Mesotoga infera]|uniref:TRAP dicarboxylate transporter, DctM subunit n=1 Tax=Mesotoga infera TaxID=1236046 RepID=A0A101I6K4_9BACT|nr:MAG: TRAP dicarboxylate transporter, DctM subunit [Mesotoga infera]